MIFSFSSSSFLHGVCLHACHISLWGGAAVYGKCVLVGERLCAWSGLCQLTIARTSQGIVKNLSGPSDIFLRTPDQVGGIQVMRKFHFFKWANWYLLKRWPMNVTDINECQTNNGGCNSDATCTNNQGSFTCTCEVGFTGNGFQCSGVFLCSSYLRLKLN